MQKIVKKITIHLNFILGQQILILLSYVKKTNNTYKGIIFDTYLGKFGQGLNRLSWDQSRCSLGKRDVKKGQNLHSKIRILQETI